MERQTSVTRASHLTPEEIESFTNKRSVLQQHEENLKNPLLLRRRSSTTESCFVEVPLSIENRVTIDDLVNNVDIILEGKFLLARCITPATKSSMYIETVIEDPEGLKAVRLALFSFTSLSSQKLKLENVLPVGTILAVKNPHFKHTSSGELILRNKNPSDIELISLKKCSLEFPKLKWNGSIPKEYRTEDIWGTWECDIFISPAPDFRIRNKLLTLGNKAVMESRFLDAVQWYSLGLEYSHGHVDMLINRAAAYYNLTCYHKALQDAQSVLSIYPFSVKGIYRKVRSLLALKRYEEAADFLDAMMLKNPELERDPELTHLSDLCETILEEKGRSEINVLHYIREAEKGRMILDAPECIGPVKVNKVPGKGRGLVTTEAVKPGTLLLCSKAFAIHHHNKANQEDAKAANPRKLFRRASSHSGMSIDPDKIDREEITSLIAHKIKNEPETGKSFYELWAGPDMDLVTDPSINQKVDIKRIQKIVQYNAILLSNNDANVINSTNCSPYSKYCGLWILPSYINHSCSEANAFWTVIGDVMLIRAVKPIRRGDEVLISYVCPTRSHRERNHLFKLMKFTCACSLCQIESNETKEIKCKRKEILDSMKEILEMHPLIPTSGLEQALTYLSDLHSLGKKHPSQNLTLISSEVIKLAEAVAENGNFPNAVELLEKMRAVSQEVSSCAVVSVQLTLAIIKCYLYHANFNQVEKWTLKLKDDMIVAFGSTKPIAALAPKSVLQQIKVNDT